MSEFDLLIRNALIVDGKGKPGYTGSIAVTGDKVAQIGEVRGDAHKEIDASGLVASPGFIDAHSHGDGTILYYPKAQSYLLQGVTTFVGGQCGGSPAPIGDKITLPGIASDFIEELIRFKYYPEKTLFPRDQVNALMKEKFGWTVDWNTMEEFFRFVENRGISMNMAPLVGQGTARLCVMGEDYKRHSTKVELAQIKGLITQAMEDGCIGLSTGLDYDPGVWASKEEINECVAVMKQYGGVYSPHWRRTGRRRGLKMGERRENKVDGILEAIESARITGVSTHLAHLTPGWRLVPEGNDVMEEANIRATLKFIDDAIGEGLDITFDAMPWFIFGGFNEMPYLCSLLTPWLRERGSRQGLAEWLRIPDYRQEIKDSIAEGKWYIRMSYNPNSNAQWAENVWVVKHKSPDCDGKTVEQIAKQRAANPLDTYFDLICEDPDCRGVATNVAESGNFPYKAYRDLFFHHRACSLSLDTYVVDNTRQQIGPPYSMPAINTFSAFPGFIIRFVRETKQFTLEQAVRKISTLAAEHYRIRNRVVLEQGAYADITLFDLEKLEVLGDPVEPRKYPKGIEHVFVNGVQVVKNGTHTDATPGRILRRES